MDFDYVGAAFDVPTEAEAKAAEKTAATKAWFSQPTWKNGPPRWQVGAAGGAGLVGLIAIGFAIFGRKS